MKQKKTNTLEEPQTMAKAIRAHCLECSCGSANEVRLCELKHCKLYKFRSGKNPNIKRMMTAEQKQAQYARLKEAREKKEVVNG